MEKSDELLLKLMLTLARDRRAMQGRIRSVGFMREYLTVPDDLGVHTLTHMTEQEREELAQSVSIKPKSEVAKFHFYLNDVRYHLLQIEGNKITILSSITEDVLRLYEQHAGVESGILASHALEEGIIKLKAYEASSLSTLLNYMLFTGTEHGPSMHQAEGLFIFEDALNMNSWTIMTREQAIVHFMEHGYVQVKLEEGKMLYSLLSDK